MHAFRHLSHRFSITTRFYQINTYTFYSTVHPPRNTTRWPSSSSKNIESTSPPSLPTAKEVKATIANAEAKAFEEAQSRKVTHVPIRAIHLARKMDIVSLFQQLYTDHYKVSHFLHKDSIVLRLRGTPKLSPWHPPTEAPDPMDRPTVNLNTNSSMNKSTFGKTTNTSSIPATSRRAADKWVVYFDYGAIVFFNCDQVLVNTLTKHATRFCTHVFDIRGHEEELMLIRNPLLPKYSSLEENCIHVQEIDHINIHVIAGVLAQTVALEYYERQIEAILSEFEGLNTTVAKRNTQSSFLQLFPFIGKLEREQQKKLFKIIATNNTLLIDLVSKLRVIDRKRPGDLAWSHIQYHSMWEALLEEFELNERFQNLNFKLELIQENTKFFMEILGTHKGERLEWYIIIIIAAELAVSAYSLLMKLE